jgi:hypothetical protein
MLARCWPRSSRIVTSVRGAGANWLRGFALELANGDFEICGAIDAWMRGTSNADLLARPTIHGNAKALEAGAWGGKLCGAGGGGFLLFLAPPERHAGHHHALGLRHVPIRVGVPGAKWCTHS